MLKITFIDVGTGDTIIIEWNDNGTNKIAIIDCNIRKTDNKNPLIDYLYDIDIKHNYNNKIEFVLLSHPHVDHFSGTMGLIDYCKKRNINIDWFCHTSAYSKDFLRTLIKNNNQIKSKKAEDISFPVRGDEDNLGNDKSKLYAMFTTIEKDITGQKEVFKKDGCIISYGKEITINTKLKLNVLAPSLYKDISRFINNPEEFIDCGVSDVRNKADANILATIISIESEDWYVLLTSDAKKEVIERVINEESNKELFNKKLVLLQIPHHGSSNNHTEVWSDRTVYQNCKNVVSVGDDNSYNLPNLNVIKYFSTNGYQCYFTSKNDIVVSKLVRTQTLLDISDLVRKDSSQNYKLQYYEEGKNLSFDIDENGKVELVS